MVRWQAVGSAASSVQIWLLDLAYADGGRETYQVPISFHTEPDESLGHALIGAVGAGVFAYDGMQDKSATGVWLRGIAGDATAEPVRFHLTAAPDQIPVGASSLVMSAEQSNTSAVFGDQAILKLFRRVDPGLNPDVEIHEALAAVGGQNVATLLGHVTATVTGPDGTKDEISLAMLQEFLSTATDGWDLAKTSVRDLMAEADLHADEAGGDFAGESFRLGAAIAQVHLQLAEAFGTSELSAADLAARSALLEARLDEAIRIVPELESRAAGVRACYAEFAVAGAIPVQRIHGDLHLGQTLRTSNRWVVLDFEGEPAKPLDERRLPDSTIRDVAGMMRSFDYASRHQIIDSGSSPQQEYRAGEWSTRNRGAFCDGYASTGAPDPRDQAALLRAYEADKAVYETVYEARNRPTWLPVPLASLDRLIAHREDSS